MTTFSGLWIFHSERLSTNVPDFPSCRRLYRQESAFKVFLFTAKQLACYRLTADVFFPIRNWMSTTDYSQCVARWVVSPRMRSFPGGDIDLWLDPDLIDRSLRVGSESNINSAKQSSRVSHWIAVRIILFWGWSWRGYDQSGYQVHVLHGAPTREKVEQESRDISCAMGPK